MTGVFTCIDQQDDVVYTSWIDSDGSVCVCEYQDLEAFYHNFRETDENFLEVFATEESNGLFEQIRSARTGIEIQRIPRLTAIYASFREKIDNSSCLVLSIGRDSAQLGYFREGRLEIPRELNDLSLRALWSKFLSSNDYLRRLIESRKATNTQVGDDSFKDFQDVLKESQEKMRGPIYWLEGGYPSDYLNAIKESLSGMDPPNYLILSNWSAFGGLPQFLQKEGYNVCPSAESPFQYAVRGLALWALNHKEKPEDVFVDCTACGKKNRVPTTRSRKRPVCGACKKPLPPGLFQQGKESLLKGDYDKAISFFDQLLQQDKSNRLFQTLWLLASIKSYKSIEGYTKKIDEVREWDELQGSEKPWVKEILTLAGKEYLEKGDLESAEKNLHVAYQIEPSGEVSALLARVKQTKGDQAIRNGELQQAVSLYEEAAAKDERNKSYPLYVQQVRTLIQRRREKKQKLTWIFLGVILAGVILGVWFGREGSPTSGDRGSEISALKKEVGELKGKNEKLARDLAKEKEEFGGQILVRDGDIKRLNDQIKSSGQTASEELKREVERLKKSVSEEREARSQALNRLRPARETIASLEEKMRRLEKQLQAPLSLRRYEVIRDTNLLQEPREDAPIVGSFRQGDKVIGVNVGDGRWLRIESLHGKPTGYIQRFRALPE